MMITVTSLINGLIAAGIFYMINGSDSHALVAGLFSAGGHLAGALVFSR